MLVLSGVFVGGITAGTGVPMETGWALLQAQITRVITMDARYLININLI
jgi:hypothetical protein